ncbi:uncharacterized protein LOC131221181 [Magnolia sinica]|uniref:uncharacterized protein LOC131221181 n=1 Tax=Magnolia sinica TaxID=86752 RepID=UPI00265B5582|nr:uncharacterized protein LOC131221181 [Magnolia sinica]
MASSCVRIQRDHNRRESSASHAQAVFRKNLKDLVRDHLHTCIALSTHAESERLENNATRISSSQVSTRQRGNGGGFRNIKDDGCNGYDRTVTQSSATSRRRQSRILDRWAARQAREMITTIERQGHEAEILALFSTHPVSTRAPSFLRETSPMSSDSSVEVPNLRASSLVQMWRELESEARMAKENRSSSLVSAASGQTNAVSTTDNASSFEEMSDRSEVCDSLDDIYDMDWESDRMAPSQPRHSPRALDVGENMSVRVADTIRKLTSHDQACSSLSSDETTHQEQCSGREPLLSRIQSMSDRTDNVSFSLIRNRPLVRGRQATRDLLARMERERQTELARLVELHAVSQFSHRSRIQAMLRFRFLQHSVTVQEQQRPASTAYELDQLHLGSSIMQLRERFSSGNQQYGSSVPVANSSSSLPLFQNNSVDSECSGLMEPYPENNEYLHVAARGQEITLSTPHSLLSSIEEQQEEAVQSPDVSWQERSELDGRQSPEVASRIHEATLSVPQSLEYTTIENLQEEAGQSTAVPWEERSSASNLDWQGTTNAIESLNSWEGDMMVEESDSDSRQNDGHADRNWLSNASHLQRESSDHRQSTYNDWLESTSDNVEICKLLERRTVSTLLASSFRERMDKLILSYLQRQGNQSNADDAVEEDEEHSVHLQEDREVDNDDDQVVSPSVQLPLPSRLFHQQQSRQHSSCAYEPSHHSLEMGLIYELRRDMERLHQEVSELRKSIESCKDMREGSPAAFQSGEAVSSTRGLMMKGSCCICYEMPVDSLLYRCGHLCTCFKCAHELKCSGRCPICRAPIIDVVRAYPGQ